MTRTFIRASLAGAIAIALAGCMSKEEMRRRDEGFAEQALSQSTRHCIDGVSYIASRVRGGYSLTPHLRPDGRPHTCGDAQ